MTQLIHTYANGHARFLTVSGVAAGDEAGTVLVTTVEDGVIAVSGQDLPEIFAQILQMGLL